MNDDEMTPPPADPALLAKANRALHEQLGGARELDEARAELAASRAEVASLDAGLASISEGFIAAAAASRDREAAMRGALNALRERTHTEAAAAEWRREVEAGALEAAAAAFIGSVLRGGAATAEAVTVWLHARAAAIRAAR